MQMRRIGPLDVSVVGIGCNNFSGRIDAERSITVVHAALDHGVNLFDTSDTYGGGGGSERALGRALEGGRRDRAVIATKFGGRMPDGSSGADPDRVRRSCDASLRRLGTDHIDLYQLHFPDEATPIADTLGAMSELVDQGKVRAIGCSNFGAERLAQAQHAASEGRAHHFSSVQNELSLLREADDHRQLVAAMEQFDMAFLPYYPLAGGLLTGKYARGQDPAPGTRFGGSARLRERWMTNENLEASERLQAWAREHGHSLLELAFSWLAAQPCVASVIAGATSAEQVAVNAAAVSPTLSGEELEELAALRPVDGRGG